MSEELRALRAELARLLALISDARASGHSALAELLTAAAAKCLVKLGDAQAGASPSPASPQPAAPQPQQQQQQQQQQQPEPGKEDDSGN
jgi:hypothetical protein